MEKNKIKNCHYCLKIRPRKNNLCTISKKNIENPRSYSCEYFLVDDCAIRLDELILSKTEDEADIRLFHFDQLEMC